MKLLEAIDRLLAISAGGVSEAETTPDRGYLQSKIDSLREFAIINEFQRLGIDNPSNYQPFYAEYDKDLQDDSNCEYTLFRVPPVIQFSAHRNGFMNAMSDRGLSIIIHPTEEVFQAHIMHPVSRIINRVHAVYVPSTGIMKVYSKGIKSFKVNGIFKTPTEVPTWNQEIDDYPISNSAFEILEEAYRSGVLPIILRTLPNKPTSQDVQTKN
jgi:hypothetical protein